MPCGPCLDLHASLRAAWYFTLSTVVWAACACSRSLKTTTRSKTWSVICKHCGRDYRAITVLHLRNIHDYDDDHPILEYKRKFHLRSALSGTRRNRFAALDEHGLDPIEVPGKLLARAPKRIEATT